MKNLKRALSLAMATVMTMGMMMVGTGAASAPDVNAEHHVTAIDVIKATGIMEGVDEEGNFAPDKVLNRYEMAVVMCKLMQVDADQYEGPTHFEDIPEDHWAIKYVNACYENKFITGISETEFGGDMDVKVVDGTLMVMKALGYFQNSAEFEGDYALATVKNAKNAGLLVDLSTNKTDVGLTRNDVAQLLLNALQADVVTFDGKLGTNITLADGTTINTGFESKYKPEDKLGNADFDGTEANKDTLQLVEKLFGNSVKLNSTDVADTMGRTGVQWVVNGENVGAVETIEADYVIEVTQSVLDKIKKAGKEATVLTAAQTVNSKFIKADVAETQVNGKAATASDAEVAKLGDVIELYMDTETTTKFDKVVVTRYKAAKVSNDVKTKTLTDGTEQVTVPGVTTGWVNVDKVVGYEELAKNDYVLVLEDNDENYVIEKADSFVGTVDGKHNTKGLLINGEYYVDSVLEGNTGVYAKWDDKDLSKTFTVYTDKAGAMIAAVEYKEEGEETVAEYAVILDTAWVAGSGIDSTNYAEAKVLYLDGTTEIVRVDKMNDVKLVDADTQIAVAEGKYYVVTDSKTWDGDKDKKAAADEKATVADGKYLLVADDEEGKTNLKVEAFGFGAALENKFTAYSVNDKGNLELSTPMNTKGDKDTLEDVAAKITNGNVDFDGTTNANANTLFIYATGADDSITYTIYTGYAEAPSTEAKPTCGSIVVDDDGIAKYVYVRVEATVNASEDLVYILDDVNYTTTSINKKPAYIYDAVVNGETTTITVDKNNCKAGEFYAVKSVNDNGVATLDIENPKATEDQIVSNSGMVLVTEGNQYGYNEDTVAYLIDLSEKESYEIAPADIAADKNDSVYVVMDNKTVVAIYVLDVDAPAPATVVLAAAAEKNPTVESGDLHTGAGKVTGWKTTDNDQVKITVADVEGHTVKITVNGKEYTNGAAYTIEDDIVHTVIVTVENAETGASESYEYSFTVVAAE